MRRFVCVLLFSALTLASCGRSSAPEPAARNAAELTAPKATALPCSQPSPIATPTPDGNRPHPAAGLTVPAGFSIAVIANVSGARELAFAPNGDLFVGTEDSGVYIIRAADRTAYAPQRFVDLPDSPAAGVAFAYANCSLYVGTQFGVYRIGYHRGDGTAQSAPVKIASLRPGGSSDHTTTSVAVADSTVYASVGSSCNACTETDKTRATVQQMGLNGGASAKAVRIRNAIALAIDPVSHVLWGGGAGQDYLPVRHPYEYIDPITLHSGVVNYGWPQCEENRHAYSTGADCSHVVIPRVVFSAYETLIGAAFYPLHQGGRYAFPARYRGGLFVTMHGSWHTPDGCNVPPRVVFVPMNGDSPKRAVVWNDPRKQWVEFAGGFQPGCSASSRIGQPTGIAVGPRGSLFVADDRTGNIYRIRP